MWDYAGGFAVATGKPGSRVPDPETVKALGLAIPKAAAPDRPAIEITVDTSQVPEMAQWAARAKELCLKAYPRHPGCGSAHRFQTLTFRYATGP